jgi:hypothetical protein
MEDDHRAGKDVPVTIKSVWQEESGSRAWQGKNSEQHRQDKHPRGSFGYAQDRLFDSAPSSAMSRDKSVWRSAQDDDFVRALKRKIPNKLALMGRSPPNAFAMRRKDSGQEQESLRLD